MSYYNRSASFKWSWSRWKNLSCFYALVRKLVAPEDPELSIAANMLLGQANRHITTGRHRCENRHYASWLGSIMSTLNPCSGSRRMEEGLAREGMLINAIDVKIMHRLGLRAIYQKPAPSFQKSNPAIPLSSWPQAGQGSDPDLGDRYHLHPVTERIPLPGGDRGSVLQKRAQLEALQQPWHGVLPRCPGEGVGSWSQARDLPLRSGLPIHLFWLCGETASREDQDQLVR